MLIAGAIGDRYSSPVIIHFNGRLVKPEDARISPFDRGFLLGDGIYEGLRSFRKVIVALDRHAERMRRALAEARIDWDPRQMKRLSADLLAANGLEDAFVYWQVTRGVPRPGEPVRTRVPPGEMEPTVLGFCYAQPPLETYTRPPTVTAVLVEDTRWTRGHVKSISLLGNVLGAYEAKDAGAQDSILHRGGLLAEGSATNLILALPEGGRTELVTPSLGSVPILEGVTRGLLLANVPGIVERPVRVEEIRRATEVLLVGSTSMVTAVTQVDGRRIGDGMPGPEAARLLRALVRAIESEHEVREWASSTAVA